MFLGLVIYSATLKTHLFVGLLVHFIVLIGRLVQADPAFYMTQELCAVTTALKKSRLLTLSDFKRTRRKCILHTIKKTISVTLPVYLCFKSVLVSKH